MLACVGSFCLTRVLKEQKPRYVPVSAVQPAMRKLDRYARLLALPSCSCAHLICLFSQTIVNQTQFQSGIAAWISGEVSCYVGFSLLLTRGSSRNTILCRTLNSRTKGSRAPEFLLNFCTHGGGPGTKRMVAWPSKNASPRGVASPCRFESGSEHGLKVCNTCRSAHPISE